jgi:biotin synthase
MDQREIRAWLREADPQRLEALWREADAVRRAHVGDAVHLRGLIELSNYCVRQCGYCGLRAPNGALERYRMDPDEILACARLGVELGYGTVVLQAGEDPALTTAWVADVVRRIKAATPLAVTLSLGEARPEQLRTWRQAGADRYLLRFETSNPRLFAEIHPPRGGPAVAGAAPSNRLELLRALRDLDYEVGSGVMVGIPGQTYDDLVRDIELFRELDLDMIGIGPFLPHPQTPLGAAHAGAAPGRDPDQVPNDELMTYKAVALARLVCPWANIPSTTALATLNRAQGRELGLARGANIVMPNLTPPAYRYKYEIYPAKACLYETAEAFHGCLTGRIAALGRSVGAGTGASPNWVRRRAPQPEHAGRD